MAATVGAGLVEVDDGRFLQCDVTVADEDPGTACQQGLGGGVTDTAGGAGDRDGLAGVAKSQPAFSSHRSTCASVKARSSLPHTGAPSAARVGL